MSARDWAPVVILIFSYVAFSIGRVPWLRSDRLAASLIGGALMVTVGGLTIEKAQLAVDGGTLSLLFGMMVISAALELSGAFGLCARWLTRRVRTQLGLSAAISVVAAFLSAFLINDVVCIALTPLVLTITKRLGCDPKPHLLALATSSNIGSVATITGNPQNILIGSVSRIPYARFSMMLAPVAIVSLAVNLAVLYAVHRSGPAPPFRGPVVAAHAHAAALRVALRGAGPGVVARAASRRGDVSVVVASAGRAAFLVGLGHAVAAPFATIPVGLGHAAPAPFATIPVGLGHAAPAPFAAVVLAGGVGRADAGGARDRVQALGLQGHDRR